jgi:hypothetical protein
MGRDLEDAVFPQRNTLGRPSGVRHRWIQPPGNEREIPDGVFEAVPFEWVRPFRYGPVRPPFLRKNVLDRKVVAEENPLSQA